MLHGPRPCQWDEAGNPNVTTDTKKIAAPIQSVLSYLCAGFLGVLFRG